jgi:hypothetical protein
MSPNNHDSGKHGYSPTAMLVGTLGRASQTTLVVGDLLVAVRVFVVALSLSLGLAALGGRAEQPSEYALFESVAHMREASLASPGYGGSVLARWDSDWYYNVASRGYRYNGNPLRQQNVAFFPAYPLITSGLWRVLGGSWTTWGLAVSWSAMLAFLTLFHALARSILPRDRAQLAVWIAGLWPPAFFGFAAYATPLIALACTAALVLALRRSWLLAAVAAGAATSTGSLGVAASMTVIGAMLLEWRRGRLSPWALFGLGVLSFWGVVGYSVFLWASFGDPLAFASVQAAWQVPAGAVERVTRLLTLLPFRHAVANVAEKPPLVVASLLVLTMVTATVLAWRKLPRVLVSYTALVLALAFLASASGTGTMSSMSRITYSATPAFLALAAVLPLRVARVLTILLAAGLAFYAWRFGSGPFVE